MITYKTQSPSQTFQLGYALGRVLKAGDVVCLAGDLGAGKTLFTQGIAAGLGITAKVTSPTFAIIQVYEGPIFLFHIDLYRLDHPDDLIDIGFEEYMHPKGITIIEWPDKFSEFLPEQRLWLDFKRGEKDSERRITVQASGRRYRTVCEELKQVADSSFGHDESGVKCSDCCAGNVAD